MANDLKSRVENKVASVEKKQPQTVKDWITAMEPQIAKALPKMVSAERFTRIALTAVSANPALAACDPMSFLGALMTSAQLGLEPNTPLGQAYLIPFKNNKKGITEATFQLGFKGLVELAHRSGEMQSIEARVVYANDDFEFEYGLSGKLEHKPAMVNRGEMIAVYAVYHLKNGGFGFEVMSVEDVRNHAKKFSKTSGFGPWVDNFEEMAKKTVLKKVLKYAPLKIEEAQQAMASDESVKAELSDDMSLVTPTYIDIDTEEITAQVDLPTPQTAEEEAALRA